MRIFDDRYRRDLRKYTLALRLLSHAVRTHAICEWTGLTDERVRSLYRSYANGHDVADRVRHRGPAPHRVAFFLRSASLRSEAAALGGLLRLTGALPAERTPNARRALPSLTRGERLCSTFELYRNLVPESPITLEHALLLLNALAQGEELEIGRCSNCNAAVLIDRLGATRRLCAPCRRGAPATMDASVPPPVMRGVPRQQSLF